MSILLAQIVIPVIVILTTAIVGSNGVVSLSSLSYKTEAFHHMHVFGPEGNYTFEWKVDWNTKWITFNVSADCTGYIGMGLSKTGAIAGSDFVVGGIDSKGKPYFSDMHGVANGSVQEDYRKDWTLLDAHRKEGRVYLSFSRPLETCDDEDYQISGDLVHVIWAYGDTDEVTLFSPHHGSKEFYLLDPDLTAEIADSVYHQIGPHSNLYLQSRWRAVTRQAILSNTNSQICTIIKGPQLAYKHYILGGGAYLPFKDSKVHVRQIILSRCVPPEGRETVPFFDAHVKREGQECNSFQNSSMIPKHLCSEMIFVWGVGGKPFYFPEEVGIPIGSSQDEYYLLEIHYYNPENLNNVTVKAGLDLMFHPRPRVYEGGIQSVNYGLYGLFTIPPRSAAFNIYGHCSSQCTKTTFPQGGLSVYAVLLQMRTLGKNIRLRHFRDKTELPWILSDDNYDGNYQQIRLLQKPVAVRSGDQLTIQCTYETLSVMNTTFSGFNNDQEVCGAYLFVNQRMPSAWCSSEVSVDNQLQHLGMKILSRNSASKKRGYTTSPISSRAEKLFTLADKNARWSPSARAALQREMLHGLQTSSCPLQKQIANYGKSRKLLINSSYKNKTVQKTTTTPSYLTPFATDSVTIPNVPLEYRPTSECQQRINTHISNFGFHRNLITNKFKRLADNLSTRIDQRDQTSSLKITPPRFRRVQANSTNSLE